MLRGDSRQRVKPKKPNGWITGKNQPEIIRRRLRDATPWDRFLIGVFFFLCAALATGAVYWYLSQPDDSHINYRRMAASTIYGSIVTPMESMTGTAARIHFLIVCLLGGIAGAVGYVVVSIADPYGTTAATKAEEKRKRNRLELLIERRKLIELQKREPEPEEKAPPSKEKL